MYGFLKLNFFVILIIGFAFPLESKAETANQMTSQEIKQLVDSVVGVGSLA